MDAVAETYSRLTEQLSDGPALSAKIHELSLEILSRAIASETNITLRKRFLQRAADVAEPASVLKLANAAATAYTRPLSKVLTSLLEKLAREAEELPENVRPQAQHSFRDLVKQIV